MVATETMIRLALQSPSKHWKHCAIIFRGGCVVGYANNTYEEHAEVRALKRVKYKHNLTVLSIRVNREGELKNAKPCMDCHKHLVDNGVKTVLYSTDEGTIERERI